MAERKRNEIASHALVKLAEETYREIDGHLGPDELLALKRYGDSIFKRYNNIKGPGMSKPWPVDNLSIKVNLLKGVISLREHPTPEELEDAQERWEKKRSFGITRKKLAGALEIAEHEPKLMLLGKPGAGKTTLLKFLAIQALRGKLKSLPVLADLKQWDKDDLLGFLAQELIDSGFPNAKEFLQQMLDQGRVILLLDDMNETGGNRQIGELAARYKKSGFIVTRRIAAENDESYFEQFATAEVTDFDESQIANFVRNWFGKDKRQAQHCMMKLKEFIPGLAVNPLLLTLLCKVQEISPINFPRSYADLLQQGLAALLTSWDEKHCIQSMEPYREMPLQSKQDLLGRIARTFFEKNQSFFLRSELEEKIGIFLLGVVKNTPADILHAIQVQHGLIVERSDEVYSFSHPCFQEYLTAWRIKEKIVQEHSQQPPVHPAKKVFSLFSGGIKDRGQDSMSKLVKHLTEYRWREVFLLSSELLPQSDADRLLLSMKQHADALIAGNIKLQELLAWAQDKAAKVKTSNRPAAVRGFYLALDRAMARAFTRSFASSRALDPAAACDPAIEHALDFALGATSDTSTDQQALALDLTLDLALTLEADENLADNLILEFPNLGNSFDHAQNLGLSNLTEELDKLKRKHPKPTANEAEWRAWEEKIRHLMLWFRNLGHNFGLEEADNKQLKTYLYANKLIAGCLHNATHVSQEVRQQILENLLLPAAIG